MFYSLNKRSLIKTALSIFLVTLFFLSWTSITEAATLSLSPASANVSVGDIVSMKVVVSTDGKSINNAGGTVHFPSDLLEVMSVSKGSSIFSLWVQEPQFSNLAGTIDFNGGVPNPGFTGQSGEIFSIIFRAKKTGTASVVFSDSSVLQNDGLGTNILTTQNAGSIQIQSTSSNIPTTTPTPVPVASSGTPSAPVVTSATNPKQEKWYNNPNADLSWNVPSDVTSVETSISKNPNSVPSVVYDSPISTKNVTFPNDGVWYFNVRFKNSNGWGAIAHYKIQVDTVPPNAFKITFPQDNSANDPRPVVYFNTTDSLSGIDHYEAKVGDGQSIVVSPQDISSHNPFILPVQDPGQHTLLVKAVDLAGNSTVESSDFTITPINTPTIKSYPAELNSGDLLHIQGTSYPLTSVEVVVIDASGQEVSQISNTDTDGSFTSIWAKNLTSGTYTFKVRAIDSRGAKSDFSPTVSFVVKQTPLLVFGSLILSWLSIVIIGIIALGGILLLMFYFIYRGIKIKKNIDKKIRSTESSVHKAFDLLRDNVREHIQSLKKAKSKRDLTKEEEKIIKLLQENLTTAEKYLEKEISDIDDKI